MGNAFLLHLLWVSRFLITQHNIHHRIYLNQTIKLFGPSCRWNAPHRLKGTAKTIFQNKTISFNGILKRRARVVKGVDKLGPCPIFLYLIYGKTYSQSSIPEKQMINSCKIESDKETVSQKQKNIDRWKLTHAYSESLKFGCFKIKS